MAKEVSVSSRVIRKVEKELHSCNLDNYDGFLSGDKDISCYQNSVVNDAMIQANVITLRKLTQGELDHIRNYCTEVKIPYESDQFIWIEGFYNKNEIKGKGIINMYNTLVTFYDLGFRYVGLYPNGPQRLIEYYIDLGFRMSRGCIDPSMGAFMSRDAILHDIATTRTAGVYGYSSPMFGRISHVLRKIEGKLSTVDT